MVYRGESVDLACPGASESGSAFWHKQEYKEGVRPLIETKFASYVSEVYEADRIQLSLNYSARGVTISDTDGHLHFPKIQLSDAGEYICNFKLDVLYHVVNVDVWGMFVIFYIVNNIHVRACSIGNNKNMICISFLL